MKLCLGTAQFGLDYGINNTRGEIPQKEVSEILNFAHDNGITMLDTASAYGKSESVLGEAISNNVKKFEIVTKYPANTAARPLQWVDTSLNFLKIQKVYGYLFHNYSIFQEHPDYIDDFIRIKEMDKTEKIGFSLYYPHEAEYILKNNIPCDIVQVPYNIFDQRFAPLFPKLKEKNIEIHIRSVFLQGLFFIAPDKLDSRFASIRGLIHQLHQIAKDNSATIASLCLGFVYSNQNITYITIGVDSLDNLKENVKNYAMTERLNISYSDFNRFALDDENIILPFNW